MPKIAVEGAIFGLYLDEDFGIGDGSSNLETITDNVFVVHESLKLVIIVLRNLGIVEVIESRSEGLPFIEDTFPRESCLKAFEDKHLEELMVVVHRLAPFVVVVCDIERIVYIAPRATNRSVGLQKWFFGRMIHSFTSLMRG